MEVTFSLCSLLIVYSGYIMYSTLHFCADIPWLRTLALIPETEKHIVVVFIFNERKVYNVMLITIWHKVIIGTKFKYPVQNRFMNTDFDFCLQCLDVFHHNTLEAWYAYFSTGEAQHFFTLMQTLPSANK